MQDPATIDRALAELKVMHPEPVKPPAKDESDSADDETRSGADPDGKIKKGRKKGKLRASASTSVVRLRDGSLIDKREVKDEEEEAGWRGEGEVHFLLRQVHGRTCGRVHQLMRSVDLLLNFAQHIEREQWLVSMHIAAAWRDTV